MQDWVFWIVAGSSPPLHLPPLSFPSFLPAFSPSSPHPCSCSLPDLPLGCHCPQQRPLPGGVQDTVSICSVQRVLGGTVPNVGMCGSLTLVPSAEGTHPHPVPLRGESPGHSSSWPVQSRVACGLKSLLELAVWGHPAAPQRCGGQAPTRDLELTSPAAVPQGPRDGDTAGPGQGLVWGPRWGEPLQLRPEPRGLWPQEPSGTGSLGSP